ncbi:DUF2384 domain-containing protein [Pinisolibacter sp. B13]|nr:DUF2384 domain-containing protein [Pinisolibacter aquiterrae]
MHPQVGRFVGAFLNREGTVNVGRVVEVLGLSKAQFTETVGLDKTTPHRASRLTAPKTQARTQEMLAIVGRVIDCAGGEKLALAWYRAERLPGFGGRTAESLVKDGRAAAVRDRLDHVATGGFV